MSLQPAAIYKFAGKCDFWRVKFVAVAAEE